MSIMGELTFFLGLQIYQSFKGIFICQIKYVKELIQKLDMPNARPSSTPMSSICVLVADDGGKKVDKTKYRGMVGSLLYLTISRPDIMFNVCKCARFQSALEKDYYMCFKLLL